MTKQAEHKVFNKGQSILVRWRGRDYIGQYLGWKRDDQMHLVSFPGWPRRSEVQFKDKEVTNKMLLVDL